jgi:N-acyl homoserine lactone hydrolase
MTKHVIRPFITSRIPCDRSVFTYLNNMGQVVMTPVIAWFIEGPDEKILVDTGISAEVCKPYWPGAEDVTPLEEALRSVQLAPEDIDIIIHSHLHFDHCGNDSMCKNATLVVQEDELTTATSGVYSHLPGQNYYPELFEGQKMQVVKGDQEIVDGLRVILTPGHSPGCQSVAVDTAHGTAVISGFCSTEHTFEPPDEDYPLPKRPEAQIPAIHINSAEAYESVMKVKKMADIILPLHFLSPKEQY